MILKTYRATDLGTALAMARQELGAEALVLATREVDTPLGVPMVEITAGAARKEQPETSEAIQALRREIATLKGKLEKPAPSTPRVKKRDPEPVTAVLRQATAALIASGLSEDLAARFARIGGSKLKTGPGSAGPADLSILADGMSAVLPFTRLSMNSRCMIVVGPAGCGKTTTVAKLAARLTVTRRGTVRFGVADTERIGALEQAAIFARHLGIQSARIDTTQKLVREIAAVGVGGTLVLDTPGIGACDLNRMERVLQLRAAVPDAEVILLIPSGIHHKEGEAILERFAPLDPTCIAFSRVDDGQRIGELVTAAATGKVPLAFLTNGHCVPDDLEEASPRGLATMMLRTGFQAAERNRETSL